MSSNCKHFQIETRKIRLFYYVMYVALPIALDQVAIKYDWLKTGVHMEIQARYLVVRSVIIKLLLL